MNSHLDHLRYNVKMGLVAMIADIIGLNLIHDVNINI